LLLYWHNDIAILDVATQHSAQADKKDKQELQELICQSQTDDHLDNLQLIEIQVPIMTIINI
jgi:hypothetical protein